MSETFKPRPFTRSRAEVQESKSDLMRGGDQRAMDNNEGVAPPAGHREAVGGGATGCDRAVDARARCQLGGRPIIEDQPGG